jgi:hypothetical protein
VFHRLYRNTEVGPKPQTGSRERTGQCYGKPSSKGTTGGYVLKIDHENSPFDLPREENDMN